MPREAIVDGDVPQSHLPFSPAVRAGDPIFVSGQASVDDLGAYVEEDFAGEMDRSIKNVARILAAAGASMDDVVQVRSFLATCPTGTSTTGATRRTSARRCRPGRPWRGASGC